MTVEYPSEPSDADLITAVRGGDATAFGALYRRHFDAARRMARTLVRDTSDVDDLVAESFTRMLGALRSGGGPDAAFRPYLLTTMRNLFYEGVRQGRRVQLTDDPTTHDPGVPFVDTPLQELELALVARAFARLPERQQLVLWHTEVERERAAQVAPLLGLNPNGVAALAYRARERLRQHYLQEHIAAEQGDDCRWTIERLGAYVRDGLSARDRTRVDAHLPGCRRCHVLFVELAEVSSRMRDVLAPALLAGSAAEYLASAGTTAATILLPLRRIIRRRSTQAAAVAAAVLAALAVLALVLTSQPEPIPAPPPGAAPQPPRPRPTPVPTPTPSPPPAMTPTPPTPSVTPSEESATPLEVALEPVGALVRGRPGVLALTVAHPNQGAITFVSFQQLQETGPLTAIITVPAGVTLRPGSPGDGWQCGAADDGIRCTHDSLARGQTSRAFVPIDVSATASGGPMRARLTAPHATATTSTAFADIRTGGLSAAFASTMRATVVTGGNRLMACPILALTCLLGTPSDNDDYFMTGYRDLAAPIGTPAATMVSGADIPVRGKVAWAGLYWAGSGTPPPQPAAHLRVPDSGKYVTVKAGKVERAAGFTQPAYQASADVTALVRGTPGGRWWVAIDHHAFSSGRNAFGGWALIIVVEDGGPLRTVAVLDGCLPLRDTQAVSTAVYGKRSAPAQIAFIGWEGDRGITGDQLKLGAQALGGDGSGNIASSRADGTPSGWHTFGVDARLLQGRMPGSPGQPMLTATSAGDAWILGAAAIVSLA